ncbi:glycerol-3-phosphate-binding periplasmic protein [Salmonella enterica subsp. enterica]|uniref:Glycerol-3-phosphate-binding periplasmic protein n=1 Tax=Salmonella enterica I TaxID=59201 RepID=A0A379WKZ5_SALET|nr:glycerol-3-phosphate-binding periplasmic protein [Salmonella enterica subsp. enterica]
MISLRHTALGLALSLAFTGQALAVTTIPFWHSMEGELGKEVDSLAQRFNQANPDYKIVPVYKGNYEQNLSAGIAAFRTGNAPAILQVYEVGTATMMASKAIKPVYEVFKDAVLTLTSPSLYRPLQATTPMLKAGICSPSPLTAPRRYCTTTKTPLRKPV